jgi:cytoskeleton protein RodZ
MTEAQAVNSTLDSVVMSVPLGADAGSLLREAREAQGMHVAMLAVALKVPVKKIEALENNRFDLLPDVVFVRALASSICRTLKVDEQAVLAALPKSAPPKIKADGEGRWASYRDSRGAQPSSWRQSLVNPWGLAVGLVVVAILLVLGWPQRDATVDAQTGPAPLVDAPVFMAPVPLEVPVAESASPASELTNGAALPLAFDDKTTQSAVVAANTPSLSGGSVPVPEVKPLLLLATDSSWVEVFDANGTSLLRRTLSAGENIALGGKLPLRVVLGRAAAVQVKVNGQTFDTTPFVRETVARFEVK